MAALRCASQALDRPELAVTAALLLRTLHAFPAAADYMDGGQHDCQEMLRLVLNLLHDDLVRACCA